MKKLGIAMLVILLATSVSAQDDNGKIYLYFSDAYNLTKNQNLTMKAYAHEEKALKYDKMAASGLRSPQFTLAANYSLMSKSIGIDMNDIKGNIGDLTNGLPDLLKPIIQPIIDNVMNLDLSYTIQENNFGVFGVGMVAPIYMGGKINVANRVAKIKIAENENKKNQNMSVLCSELAERYFGLSLARQVSIVKAEVTEGMAKHLKNAIALEENGIIARGERLYAEMFLNKAKTDQQKSNRDILSINTALENTLNANADYYTLTDLFILTSIEPVDYFKQYALINSPLLKQVDFSKQLANQQVILKRAEILPTVSAIGAANIVDYNLTNIVPRAMIGISVNYKLFNGAKNIHDFKSSKETVKRIEILEEKTKLDISTLIEKNYNDLLSLAEQVVSYNTTIAFSEEYLRVKEKAFSEGVASSADVIDAQLNLAKSKTEKMELAYKYDVALAKLLEVCGLSEQYQLYMVGVNSRQISY